ncbi:oligosaccharyltransferase 48 kDa subunit beta domain-containing protein [Ditylenchus destructor]|nr:oligosaccharyltransferase 48 kDa subunit beta domain-containing protein [Ditylenchus destructor]
MTRILFYLLFLLFVSRCVKSDRILVLVDNLAIRETHSTFLKSLEDRGHSLKVQMADDASLSLIQYGEFLYDHLVIFAPSVEEFGGTINVPEITKFIDGGGNILVAAGSSIGDAIRELTAEVGFEFDEDKTQVIDHFNYDAVIDDGTHTTIVAPSSQLIGAELITGDKTKINPVLFRGTALVADLTNKLRLEVMTAATTAYSFNPNSPVDEYPAAVGKSTILIGAIQARNNARVVVAGSLDMFSNEFLKASVNKAGSADKAIKSGNLELVTSLSKWVFKESGVLRVTSVKHNIVGASKPPREYTIEEEVSYEIHVEELKNGKWIPFQGKDMQLEFVRIDPFVRTALKNNNGKLSTVFKVPDVYGVFKFLVDYRRVGYTHLYDVQQVSVRPLKHNQYERFVTAAYPYYVSAFSMMIGVFIFSFVFLYYKDSPALAATAQPAKIATPAGKTSK